MKTYTLEPTDLTPKKLSIDYQKELNQEQYDVVIGGDGPCLVLAGAGSGKTRTLVYRVAYLLERGVPPDQILLVTFTNKAAKEMLTRIEELLQFESKKIWGGTFHHVGNRLLRMYGKHINLAPSFTILDDQDSKDLVKSSIAQVVPGVDKYFPKPDVIQHIVSLAKNTQTPIRDIISKRYTYFEPEIALKVERIAEVYREKKINGQTLDYDDLLWYWLELLNHPEIGERIAGRFSYVLVDEYQDTNALQSTIIEKMAQPHGNVLVVGDDAQSIYSFRGADVANILSFPKLFSNAKMFKLQSNYRSTPEILQLANFSIKNNSEQFAKDLVTTKNTGDKPIVVAADNGYQQAQFICQRVLELQRDQEASLNEIAVLFRSHFQSLELELELNKRGIPYVLRGGVRFFEQAHIKDVLAHLKVLVHVNDELSWQRLLKLQQGIGAVGASKIWKIISSYANISEVISLDLAEALPAKPAASWRSLIATVQKLMAIGQKNVSELIQTVLHSGYATYIINSFDNATDRLDDIQQLALFASRYEAVEELLADAALSEGFSGETVQAHNDGPDEAITLSTIHQAKGLEWKSVFVIGLVDGQFPHAKIFSFPKELEEERRLFYVAVTRARSHLYMTYPLLSLHTGNINQQSQFLKELPDNLYEIWNVQERSLTRRLSRDSSGPTYDYSDQS